jgi:seryl-tRNA synthetase
MRHAKVVVTLAAVLMVVAMASAQTSRQAASSDTAAVEALTAEIRALRAELAESARTGLRLQLLTARIQAQEQRIIHLDRQRGEAVTRRVNLEQVRNEVAAQVGRFGASELSALATDQRRDVEFAMADTKRRLADQDRLLQQAQTDENEAVNALSQEQSRWGDLNTRVDDLERSLGAR